MGKVVIIMGSPGDLDWANLIKKKLDELEIDNKYYVASAHKAPLFCYDTIKKEEAANTVFITIAGLSNALSGFTDAQTFCPVIACPPLKNTTEYIDLYSSIRMPSGVSPMVVLRPDNAALAAAKILAINDDALRNRIVSLQEKQRDVVINSNVK